MVQSHESLLGTSGRFVDALWDRQSAYWSLGATLVWNLFEGYRTDARVQASQASQQAAIAAYRQTVLRAFQEVEDALSSLRSFSRARESAELAVASTGQVLQIANDRYQGGAASYLEVITAQQGVLGNQRLVAQLHGQQLVTTAFLAKALGGGFGDIQRKSAIPARKSLN